MNPPPHLLPAARDKDTTPACHRPTAGTHRLLEATRRRILAQAARARRAQTNCLASLARDLLA